VYAGHRLSHSDIGDDSHNGAKSYNSTNSYTGANSYTAANSSSGIGAPQLLPLQKGALKHHVAARRPVKLVRQPITRGGNDGPKVGACDVDGAHSECGNASPRRGHVLWSWGETAARVPTSLDELLTRARGAIVAAEIKPRGHRHHFGPQGLHTWVHDSILEGLCRF
jgi:hypothetical protein